MDSKAVNKEIRKIIKPLLKELGFSNFTARNAWRYHKDRIDVINFQSFNSYHASLMDITTFSFAVNLGCYLLVVPEAYPIKEKNGLLIPSEYDCQFRGNVLTRIKQREDVNKKICLIQADGGNIEQVLTDVREQIINVAVPWFKRLYDWNEILYILCNDEGVGEYSSTAFGADPSPCRSYLVGCVAFYLRDMELAEQKLQEAVDSGCFTDIFSNLKGALKLVSGKCAQFAI